MTKIEIVFAKRFTKEIKRLSKKYRGIQTDVNELLDELQSGKTPGDRIQGIGYRAYKVRISATDVNRGKHGGYRVIYYVQTEERLVILTIYAKTERVDIPPDEIRQIIEELNK